MDVGGIAGNQLRAFVERYERIQEEIDALNDDRAELMKRIAGAGFDKKIFKIVIKRRRMGKEHCDEEDTLVALYERALEEHPAEDKAEPVSRARTREETEPVAAAAAV